MLSNYDGVVQSSDLNALGPKLIHYEPSPIILNRKSFDIENRKEQRHELKRQQI